MNNFSSQIIDRVPAFPVAPKKPVNFYVSTNIDKENRGAPRHKVSLQSPILITAVKTSAPGIEEYFVMRAQLLDVSVSGLGIALDQIDLRGLRRFGLDPTLRLMLPLPLQAIHLEAKPVRCRQINATQVLIGAQVLNMSGRDRVIFMDFINQCDSINLYREERAA